MTSVIVQDLLSMMTIGDGVATALFPRQHMQAWAGVMPFRQCAAWFADRPNVTRAMGIASVGLGVFWTSRLYRSR